MKRLLHFVFATVAYIFGLAIGFIFDVLIMSVILGISFFILSTIAGVLNGTGTLYIWQSVSDGIRLAVVLSALYVAYSGFIKYPVAINAYFDHENTRRSLRE